MSYSPRRHRHGPKGACGRGFGRTPFEKGRAERLAVALYFEIGPWGITNGASFRSGGTPGGAIATIFGINLSVSAVDGIEQATSTPLPTELGGTSGASGGEVDVVITMNGVASNTAKMAVQ